MPPFFVTLRLPFVGEETRPVGAPIELGPKLRTKLYCFFEDDCSFSARTVQAFEQTRDDVVAYQARVRGPVH